jgi:hypothetical protein
MIWPFCHFLGFLDFQGLPILQKRKIFYDDAKFILINLANFSIIVLAFFPIC